MARAFPGSPVRPGSGRGAHQATLRHEPGGDHSVTWRSQTESRQSVVSAETADTCRVSSIELDDLELNRADLSSARRDLH